MIREIDIRNFRSICEQKWILKEGFFPIPMDPGSGKTTLLDALRTACFQETAPAGAEEASIRVVVSLEGVPWTCQRTIRGGVTNTWIASDGSSELDLRSAQDRMKFRRQCGHAADAFPIWIARERYRDWIRELMVPEELRTAEARADEAFSHAYGRVLQIKQSRGTKHLKVATRMRIEKELVTLDKEIAELQRTQERIETELSERESDFARVERSFGYVEARLNELAHLEYEERLEDRAHFEEPDVSELKAHFDSYQQLQEKIRQTEARSIELRHYEKNLRGLQEEITRIAGSGAEQADERAAIYLEEMTRLQQALQLVSTADHDAETLREEARTHQAGASQYALLTRGRSRGPASHVRARTQKREALHAELKGLDVEVVRSEYETIRQRLLLTRQQNREWNHRIQELLERRLRLLSQQPLDTAEPVDMPSLDTRRFLDIVRLGLGRRIQELEAAGLSEMRKRPLSTTGQRCGEAYAQICENLEERALTGLSESERLFVQIALQGAATSAFTRFDFCFLPEHTTALLAPPQLEEIRLFLTECGFRQILFFVRP